MCMAHTVLVCLCVCSECQIKRKASHSFGADPSSGLHFTPCQIRRHDNLGSCWLVANRTVYDVTTFAHDHPGGAKSILRFAGGKKDTGEDMLFHSVGARKQWKSMAIGKVRGCGDCAQGEEQGCVVM